MSEQVKLVASSLTWRLISSVVECQLLFSQLVEINGIPYQPYVYICSVHSHSTCEVP